MAEFSSKHVTWEGLQYYDSKIRQYVDTVATKLSEGSVAPADIVEIKQHLASIDELLSASKADIQVLLNDNTQNRENIDKLFEFDRQQVEQIARIEEILKTLATKEELLTTTSDIKTLLDDVKELEEAFLRDHKTIEDIRLDLEGKVDQAYVDNAIKNISSIDLNDYYTKDEVDELIPNVQNFVTTDKLTDVVEDLNSDVATVEGMLVGVQTELEEKANKTDIPSLTGYATEEYVLKKIAEAELADQDVDLSAYYTKSETEAAIKDAVDSIDISNLATKDELREAIESIEYPTVDLEDYAKKSDLVGLASESYVDEKIAEINISESDLFVVEFTDPDFNAASEAYSKGKLLVLKNAAPDPNSYAVMNYVRADMITFTKFLTSRSEAYGAFNTYYLNSNNKWEVSKEVLLNKVEANVPDAAVGELTKIRIGKEVYTIPNVDLTGYAKSADVTAEIAEAVAGIAIPDITNLATKSELEAVQTVAGQNSVKLFQIDSDLVDINAKLDTIPSLEGYATEQWVKDELEKIDPSIPSEYITETELLEKGYITSAALTDYAKSDSIPTKTSQLTNDSNFLTEHQDISGKADKSDLEGLATEQFVTDCISNIKHPEPDLSNYYTKGETDSAITEAVSGIKIPEVNLEPYATKAQVVEQVSTKADNIPFTTDTFVTNAMGEFLSGENLNGLTMTEILTKLLGLNVTSKYSIKYYVDSELFAEQTYAEGETIVTPKPDPVKEGYEFDGWKINDFYITNVTTMPAYDVEAHAFFNALPEEPKTLAEQIIANELPMYSIKDYTVTEVPFKLTSYDESTAAAPITETSFYQIKDDTGAVIESGYEDLTINKGDVYYIIALPSMVDYNTMVTLKTYDEMNNSWVEIDKMPMTNDIEYIRSICSEDPQMYINNVDLSKYTLWMNEEPPTGRQLRFIINE